MKITVDIDCTPSEARRLMGLPDFEPMQQAVMVQMEKAALEQMSKLSPEGLFETWFSTGPASMARLQEMMAKAAFGARPTPPPAKPGG